MSEVQYDEIGYWSEIKLDIVREYAQAYSTVLTKRKEIRKHLYIDAFAGAGVHISKQTGEFVLGSPLNALNVRPPFTEYHFIDLDGDKAANLQKLTARRPKCERVQRRLQSGSAAQGLPAGSLGRLLPRPLFARPLQVESGSGTSLRLLDRCGAWKYS